MSVSGAARKTQFSFTRGVPEHERPIIFFGSKRVERTWLGFAGWHVVTTWAITDEDSFSMMFMDRTQPYVLIDRESGEYEVHGRTDQ